eukprot:c43593_g1_i1 orf=3-248(-)
MAICNRQYMYLDHLALLREKYKRKYAGCIKHFMVWYQKIHAYSIANGVQNSLTERTLYVCRDGDNLLILILYVDDMLITHPS